MSDLADNFDMRYERLANLSKSNSFFLFGPRGTGKTTYIHDFFKDKEVVWLDFLNIDNELRYKKRPQLLYDEIVALETTPEWIVIDEVQKVPKLLDVVHALIEEKKIKFALTGSSARKLKRTEANMLGGRAFNFSLFSFSFLELKDDFILDEVLSYGSLPKLYSSELSDFVEKKRYLKSYVSTYIKEEIIVEQLVRNIEPFHRFLEVAAQQNSEIINYSNIAREANITDKSVARYFEILSDTLMGFLIPAYNKSVRKQQIESPKFYFFDIGVVRAIKNHLDYSLTPQTYEYGKLFESLVISEIYKLNKYFERDFKLYYLKTKEGQEIDLIVETPYKTIVIEIKSGEVGHKSDVKPLIDLLSSFKNASGFVFCLNQKPLMLNDNVKAVNWKDGIEELWDLA